MGRNFVAGLAEVPKKVYTYKGDVESFSYEKTTIYLCFDSNFDYHQTMTEMAA